LWLERAPVERTCVVTLLIRSRPHERLKTKWLPVTCTPWTIVGVL
jgi:hypothetical protein